MKEQVRHFILRGEKLYEMYVDDKGWYYEVEVKGKTEKRIREAVKSGKN